jgi:siroheme synthase-like protein
MAKNYPVFLNLQGRRCLVIGGGPVATHKALGLLECDAKVTIVSPTATRAIRDLAKSGAVTLVRRAYAPGDMDGVYLAIAATNNPAVNQQIAREAEKRHVLLNVVDVADLGDFFTPAVIQRGQVTVAISTSGASPALARKLREEIAKANALQWADLADVLAEARAILRQEGIKATPQRWQEAITPWLLALVHAGEKKQALAHLLDALKGRAKAEARR